MAAEEQPEPFKPGDVVRLKTGGPKMTVEKIAGDKVGGQLIYVVLPKGDVQCVWFDENRQLHRERFRAAALDQA